MEVIELVGKDIGRSEIGRGQAFNEIPGDIGPASWKRLESPIAAIVLDRIGCELNP